jgi:hypothetical protein
MLNGQPAPVRQDMEARVIAGEKIVVPDNFKVVQDREREDYFVKTLADAR